MGGVVMRSHTMKARANRSREEIYSIHEPLFTHQFWAVTAGSTDLLRVMNGGMAMIAHITASTSGTRKNALFRPMPRRFFKNTDGPAGSRGRTGNIASASNSPASANNSHVRTGGSGSLPVGEVRASSTICPARIASSTAGIASSHLAPTMPPSTRRHMGLFPGAVFSAERTGLPAEAPDSFATTSAALPKYCCDTIRGLPSTRPDSTR